MKSLIIQLGVKECLVLETTSTKAQRGQSRKRKVIGGGTEPIDLSNNDDDEMDGGEGSSNKDKGKGKEKEKGKGKDEHDVNKLLGMIERCGVVITEVQSSELEVFPGKGDVY